MTYEALCVLCECKGWTIVVSAKHEGPTLRATDAVAYLHAVSIWWRREDWLAHREQPGITALISSSLDQAAEVIETLMREAGALK